MPEPSSETVAPQLDELLAMLPMEDASPETIMPQDVDMICESKTLYEGASRCDSGCCINWVENPPQLTKEAAEETSEAKRHAIICRVQKAHGGTTKPLELHSIVIQSPVLKAVLGEVFAEYPGITTTLEKLEFHAPFWEFFYRWQALKDAQDTQDTDRSAHIRLLLKELTSRLADVHHKARDLVQNKVMTYDFLWILFPPGTLVYFRTSNKEYLLEVLKTDYYNETIKTYDLTCKYVEWDGKGFGWKKILIEIPKFSGTRPIEDLEVYPVTYHRTPEDTQLQFLKRGRNFASLGKCQQKAYCGSIWIPQDESHSSEKWFAKFLEGKKSKTFRINERIMVDAEAFFSQRGSSADLDPLDSNDWGSGPEGVLPDRLLKLCSPVVKAYALKSKQWGEVEVDGISDIDWDQSAFDNLVLEKDTKLLIESVVFAQVKQGGSSAFDDIVEGKGQGMVILLTGEPGIGKTLTAETVAERACRPLYMLSAGELGITSYHVEAKLIEIFGLAYRWNAVLLLDESDIFLEQRTSENLERNQLVSIFLRQLEYYRGILFLTTNRVSVFDVAFQSRIHFTLPYHGLDQVSRRRVWQILLERTHADLGITEEDLRILAEEPLNGRQIKNAAKGANLLAEADNIPLNVDHIKLVLRVMRQAQNPGGSSPLANYSEGANRASKLTFWRKGAIKTTASRKIRL